MKISSSKKKSVDVLKPEELLKKIFKDAISIVVRKVDEMKLRKEKEKKEKELLRTKSQNDDTNGETKTDKKEEEVTIEQVYRETMKKFVFKMLDIDTKKHHYSSTISGDTAAAKKRTKKLKKDLKQLKKDLPLEFGSSIFVRVDKSKPHVMQCMITGPGDTPYDSGCFQFDVYCPNSFPG